MVIIFNDSFYASGIPVMPGETDPVDSNLTTCLKKARNIFVFTGAGVSKESGLPTFRDDDGLWKKYDPMTLATTEAFNSNPVAVWNMYRIRQKQIMSAQPNPAHITLARMDDFYPEYLLCTQNVDDLHERAGTKRMVKLHGDALQMRCIKCGHITDIREFDLPEEFTEETLPKCSICEGLCRPNIVWFGEFVPDEPLMVSAMSASNCDVMLIVGTSGEVSGGYGFAEYAHLKGAAIIEINPVRGALNHLASYWVPQPAGEALPVMWKAVTDQI